MHQEFINKLLEKVRIDPTIKGLAVGGSWIDNQIDQFSDIDLVLITGELVSDDFNKMYNYAEGFGNLLNAFTGEHVGEKRLLICLFDDPLIHVDIKFIVIDDLKHRIENPVILWDPDGEIKKIIETTFPERPSIDYQWIEDRFWTWIHYASLKLGRGEYFEALDFLSFLRLTVLSPLIQVKHGQSPRGVRKIEQAIRKIDLEKLKVTIPGYSPESIALSVERSIRLYQELRNQLCIDNIIQRSETEKKCIEYFYQIKKGILDVNR
jgi:hypothetical protein